MMFISVTMFSQSCDVYLRVTMFSQSCNVLSNQVAASLRALAVGGGCSHGDEDGDGSGPNEVHPPALQVFKQTVSTLYLNVDLLL